MRATSTLLLPLAFAGSTYAAAVKSSSSCFDLWDQAPKLIPNLEVYVAKTYPGKPGLLPLADASLEAGLTDVLSCSTAGTNFTTKYATASYPAPVPDMPEFCRFGAYFHTSNISKVRARHPFPRPLPSP